MDHPDFGPGGEYAPARRERGWYSRGYLPHYDSSHCIQFVTWRLADSIPKPVQEKLEHELSALSLEATIMERERRVRIEKLLDRSYGECWLRRGACASLVRDVLLSHAGEQYHLHGFVIMPNHVHVLAHFFGTTLGECLEHWKSVSAKEANAVLLREGAFWHDDFWDRYIRDEDHYTSVLNYIRFNPVRARLVKNPNHWRWTWFPGA